MLGIASDLILGIITIITYRHIAMYNSVPVYTLYYIL